MRTGCCVSVELMAANGRKLLVLCCCCGETHPRPPPWGCRIRCRRMQEARGSLCCGGGYGGGRRVPCASGPCLMNLRVLPAGHHWADPQPGPVPGQPWPAAGGGRHPTPGAAAGEGSPGCAASRGSRHTAALHGESRHSPVSSGWRGVCPHTQCVVGPRHGAPSERTSPRRMASRWRRSWRAAQERCTSWPGTS